MPDSRTIQPSIRHRPIYATSFQSSDDEVSLDLRGPISEQPYEHVAKSYINGLYVQIGETVSIAPLIEPDAVNEFAAWEAASDEALLNFENSLD